MAKRLILTILGLAFCSISVAQTPWDIELPDGQFVGGFVEDEGNAVALLNRRAPDWWRSERASWSAEDGSFFARLAPDGSIIDTIDLPDRRATGVWRLADRRLALFSSDMPDQNHVSAWHRELIELAVDGEIKRIWGWNTRDRPDWSMSLTVADDGRAWAIHSRGELPGSKGSHFDRLYISWGDGEPPEGEIDGEVVLRFGDAEDDGLWRHAWELGYPSPVFLDSIGPVFSVVWKDRTYLVHMDEDGSVERRIRVFGDESERRSGWQPDERVQWSWTDEYLRAYHLPDLGLSDEVTKPFWIVDRKAEDGDIRVHRERGVIALRGQFLSSPDGATVLGEPESGGRFKIDHIWRGPQAPDVEERRTTGWQTRNGGGFPYWVTVSPNARFVLAVEQYTNRTRIIAMDPAPPVPEP